MKPIKIIFWVLFISLAICQSSFIILNNGLKKFNSHTYNRLAELLENKTSYDILFIGSSRTHSNINPSVIDSICNLSSYNAGIEGGNIFEFKMIFDAYLENHPAPKYLFLTIDLTSFNLTRKIFKHIQYYPFINNTVINNYLCNAGHNTTHLHLLPFLEYTEYDDYTKNNCLKGYMNKNEILMGDFQYKGFLSNTSNSISDKDTSMITTTSTISELGKNLLQSILQTCKEKNIQAIITYAPEYKKGLQKHISNSTNILNVIHSISINNKIPFLKDDALAICNNPKLFANIGHLNRFGAQEYSKLLAEKINKLIFDTQLSTK
jgi:hypothetical protein